MAIGITCLAALAAAGATGDADWRDDFDGGELHPRWTWRVPVEGPSVSLAARTGWLRLAVPRTDRGFNHWINEQRAALLTTPAPAGDWDMTARITLAEWSPDSNLHLALVVGFSEAKLLAWGPFLSKQIYDDMARPGIWAEPTGHGAYLKADASLEDLELRIAKRVATYGMALRESPADEWRTVGVYYLPSPPEFVGLMGKSFGPKPAGVLDIDYIAVRAAPPRRTGTAAATIRLGEETGVRLDPMQRGFFLEFLGHCIFRGIWDERLQNRKFIGPAEADGTVWAWEPTGSPTALAPDWEQPLAEPQSLRVELGKEGGGVAQSGLGLQANASYAIRLAYRTSGSVRAVTVALAHREDTVVEHTFGAEGRHWQDSTCELPVPRDIANASLRITAMGPGRLWLGAASLMRADSVDGFRRDLLERTRRARPPIFRWPGGNMASGYQWRDGIGPRDRRPTRWDRAWNAWVYNDMGTHEFIRYCRLLDAEPRICVNAGEGTAADAAAWVEYCNGGTATPMGALRARNGHPEPFNVKYWDVGNEIWGPWQLGHVGPEHYGLRAVEFARAMREADPEIVLIASGVPTDSFDNWNGRALPICGRFVDMLSVHDYTRYDSRDTADVNWPKLLKAPVRIESMLRETARIAQEAAGKPLPLTFDEWNTTPADPAHHGTHCLGDGLYAAGVFHALHRCGSDVPIGHLALLANVLGAIRTDQTRLVETPVFQAFRLYADHSAPRMVQVRTECGTLHGVPAVDAVASLSKDRGQLHVTVINRHPHSAVAATWKLGAIEPSGEARVSTLTGPEPMARNLLSHPDTVTLRRETVPWSTVTSSTLPPASVTGITVPVRTGQR